MTFIHEREQAFEAKFAHDEEHRFLVRARRDKLFAAWAAGRMHMSDADRQALVATVLKILDGRGHDQALLALIGQTLRDHGQAVPDAELLAALVQAFAEAEQQVSGTPVFLPNNLQPGLL